MTKILVIRSSANGAASVSNQLIDSYLAALATRDPETQVTQRDLDREPVPHVTSATLAGIGRPAPETPETKATRAFSDELIAQVFAADTLVFGLPMYNFGIPSMLKSWFDHVLRAGTTFTYTAAGPQGLVTGKRAVILAARGGVYVAGGPDYQVPHIKALLGLVGITDVEVVLAEGLARGPDAATAAITAAKAAIDHLVSVPA